MERKPGAGAIIIAPAWDTCGSYEVFKGQLRTLSILGFETYLLAVPGCCMPRKLYRQYRRDYRRLTAAMPCDHRDEARLPLFAAAALRRFEASCAGQTAARRATQAAHVMELPRSLRHFIRKQRELFVLCNHYFNIPLVQKLQKLLRQPVKFALETHDIQSRHYRQREAPMTDAAYQQMLAEELAFVTQADHLIHISQDEFQTFASALPQHRHELIYPSIAERTAQPAPQADPTFLIVAAPNEPNADSLAWFLNQVWARYTGAGSLRIVGAVDRLMIERHPATFQRWATVFTGRVEDLTPHYAAAAVVVVPVIAGEGISIKFAEAMAFGKQVLFTPRAARGIPAHSLAPLGDGLCQDADSLLAKLHQVPIAAPPQISQPALRLYRELFSQDNHTVAYHEISAALTNHLGAR